MFRRALIATTLSLSLTACGTLTPPPKGAAQALEPIRAAMACPAPPASLTTPVPVPEPPQTAGSYQELPAYVLDLLAWIRDDLDRARRREGWQSEWCVRPGP